MKFFRMTIPLLLFFAAEQNEVHSQTVDSSLGYYPMHQGDYWVYHYSKLNTADYYFSVTIGVDTTMTNGCTYLGFVTKNWQNKSSTISYRRVDSSTGCVFEWKGEQPELMIDSLRARQGNSFNSGSTWRVCYNFGPDTILGYPTSSRWVGGVIGSASDKFAFGVGWVAEYLDDTASWLAITILLYARIDGKDYGTPLSVLKKSNEPQAFSLGQNFPNPFNPSTTIRFSIPEKSRVRMTIFNLLGQQVVELANEEMTAGSYERSWNANAASGMYFYRIEAISMSDPGTRFFDVKKMMLLK